jgi:hypothetical protein
VAKFYSARSKTISQLPWLTFALPFSLMAGVASLTQMMNEDVARLAGDRYEHYPDKPGYRWGQTKSQAGFHGGKIKGVCAQSFT